MSGRALALLAICTVLLSCAAAAQAYADDADHDHAYASSRSSSRSSRSSRSSSSSSRSSSHDDARMHATRAALDAADDAYMRGDWRAAMRQYAKLALGGTGEALVSACRLLASRPDVSTSPAHTADVCARAAECAAGDEPGSARRRGDAHDHDEHDVHDAHGDGSRHHHRRGHMQRAACRWVRSRDGAAPPLEMIADVYRILGDALRESGRYERAVRALARAVQLGDDDAVPTLAHALAWTCRTEVARRVVARAASRLPPGERMVDRFAPWLAVIFFKAQAALRPAQQLAARLDAAAPGASWPAVTSERLRRWRTGSVRVGWVTADFAAFSPAGHDLRHAVRMLPRAAALTCYSLALPDASELYEAMRTLCPRYVDLSALDDDAAAARVRADGVDVLVHLNGYTAGERSGIFARRPAVVQLQTKGYMASMGAPFVPFTVVDRISVTPQMQQHFTEKLLYKPHCTYVCDLRQQYSWMLDAAPLPRANRTEYGLPVDAFVMACFNRLFKVDDHTLRMWMSVLQRAPNSVLWLLLFPPDAERAIRRWADDFGIAQERIVFTELFDPREHLLVKGLADLFLDTPRFNAHGTAAEALFAGVPVLTLPRDHMARRLAASIVYAALPERYASALVVRTEEAYVRRAVQLAERPALVQRLRDVLLRGRAAAPLFNTQLWLQHTDALQRLALDQRAALGARAAARHIVLRGANHHAADARLA